MERSALLLTHPPPPPHPWRPKYHSLHTLSQKPLPSSHFRRPYTPSYRRWDSNAETFRSQRFGFNNKRYEEDEDDDDEEEEYDYDGWKGKKKKKKRRWWSDESWEMEEEESGGGILEDSIDSIWILKIFKSYGWALPPIILSLLLSTGPKAFLMALALPLGQAAFSLAFEKLWGRTESRPKRKSRTRRRRKPFASTVGNVEKDEKEDEDQETSDKKMGYQSWVVGNDVSVDNSGQDASSLGGWDDLERMESARRKSRRKPTGKGKLSQRERTSDTPLLLRLLIAAFPFLGSWTKMFW